MYVRKLLVLLIIFGLLVLPLYGGATTYKFSVKTATLAVDPECRGSFINGVPAGPYTFEADPAVLRVGDDPVTGWVYQSIIVFDWGQMSIIPQGAHVQMSLCITPAMVPRGYGEGAWTEFAADQSVPILSDFDVIPFNDIMPFWLGPNVGQRIEFDGYPYTSLIQGENHHAFLLYPSMGGGLLEIAGNNNDLGLDAPSVLVTTVPEPCSMATLVAGIFAMGSLVKRTKRRLLSIIALTFLLCGVSYCESRNLPDGFTVLPSFPRLWWSFGCVPTSGAMICGYYDVSGFPRMACYPTNDADGESCIPHGRLP